MARTGRPSLYSPQIAEEICVRMSEGESLRKICQDPRMPSRSVVHLWLHNHREFSDQYALARERLADFLADECLSIVDDKSGDILEGAGDGRMLTNSANVQRDKLRFEARKWAAGQMAPKKWNQNHTTTELTGANGGPIQTQAVDTPPQETMEEWLARKKREEQERNAKH